MTQQTIITTPHNSGLGDPVFTAFEKVNANFTELYTPINRTAAEIAAGVTPTNIWYAPGNVLRYGADPTNTNDSAAAFTNAMRVTSLAYAPTGIYKMLSGIVVPNGVELRGDGCFATNPQAGGTVLSFANSVATCVTLINGLNNGAANLRALTVSRTVGAPPANSVGVYVFGGYPIFLTEVFSYNHAIGFSFKGAAGGLGLGAHLDKISTGAISDAHIQIDTWPELYCLNSRFGMNGVGDLNGNTYVRVKGGVPGSANGPNTIHFIGCQFNQGSNLPSYFWTFVNLNGTLPTTDATDFLVSDSHIEGVSTAYFFSDATWNIVDRLIFEGNVLNTVVPLFALNAATQPSEWQFVGNDIFASTLTLAPTNGLNAVTFSANRLACPVTITGVSGSTANFRDNWYGGNFTASGVWSRLSLGGGGFTSGGFLWSGTAAAFGSLDFSGPFASGSWVVTLSFGGGSGWTYTRQAASYQIVGSRVFCDFSLILASLGTGAGGVQISGLPFPIANNNQASGGGGAAYYDTGLAGLTSPILLSAVNINTSAMVPWQQGAAGVSQLTAANLTATAAIYGNFNYAWQ